MKYLNIILMTKDDIKEFEMPYHIGISFIHQLTNMSKRTIKDEIRGNEFTNFRNQENRMIIGIRQIRK